MRGCGTFLGVVFLLGMDSSCQDGMSLEEAAGVGLGSAALVAALPVMVLVVIVSMLRD